MKKKLLSILEVGGYPNFSKLYESFGYEFVQVDSMRKATKFLKKQSVSVIIAEFNFQSDFRDRTSQLETLMACIQPYPEIKVIVFYEKEQAVQLERLTSRFDFLACLSYPIAEQQLTEKLSLIH